MASCDFSTHQYSYDDADGDLELKHFALAPEDLKYKVSVFLVILLVCMEASFSLN